MAYGYVKMLNIVQHRGNEYQKHNEVSLHTLLKWLLSRRQEVISIGKDVEKREPLCAVGENVHWCSHCG